MPVSEASSELPRAGFTLIELLVTISIFSAALSAVVVTLYSAVQAWDRLRESQRRSAEIELALTAFATDARHLAPLLDFRLREEVFRPEAEAVTFACYDLAQAARPGNWWVVAHRVEQDSGSGASNWVRDATPCIGGRPVEALRRETVILSRVRELRFAFLSQGGRHEHWGQDRTAPAGIDVIVVLDSGASVRRRAWVPAGALEGGR